MPSFCNHGLATGVKQNSVLHPYLKKGFVDEMTIVSYFRKCLVAIDFIGPNLYSMLQEGRNVYRKIGGILM